MVGHEPADGNPTNRPPDGLAHVKNGGTRATLLAPSRRLSGGFKLLLAGEQLLTQSLKRYLGTGSEVADRALTLAHFFTNALSLV